MRFKCYTLLVDEELPSIDLIRRVQPNDVFRFMANSYIYEFSCDIKDDKYFLMAVDFDDLKYRDKVYDIETEKERANPKKRSERELKQQFFACYDIAKKELYISDQQKKGAITRFIKERLDDGRKVIIRERISSVDEFAKTVQAIKKIKYTQTRNLVNENPDSLFAQRYDPLGLDIPDRLVTSLEYHSKINAHNVIEKLRTLFNKRKTMEIESIEIIGEDSEGFDQSFSLDTIIKTIEISIETDEDGRYENDNVFTLLLQKLRGKAYVQET